MKYLVVVEKSKNGYGAYVPDLPGCVAVARTIPKVNSLIKEAIALHIEDIVSRGQRVPKPHTKIQYVETSAA